MHLKSENTQLKVINIRDQGFQNGGSVAIQEHEKVIDQLKKSQTEVLKYQESEEDWHIERRERDTQVQGLQ